MIARLAVLPGALMTGWCAAAAALTADLHWVGAGCGTALGTVLMVVGLRMLRRDQQPFDLSEVDVADDYPLDRAELERAFNELDLELRHPSRLRNRMAAVQARRRDRCGLTPAERVAWVGLAYRAGLDYEEEAR